MKTKEQIEAEILVLNAELKALDNVNKQVEMVKFFNDTINSLTNFIPLKKDKYPNELFWFKGDKFMFSLDKNMNLWCNYDLFWNVFNTRFGLNCQQTQAFIKSQVEETFKLKGVTPDFNRYRSL